MNNSNKLTTRHILMIALGSAIGTGFFFGTGASIKLAGPSIILSYAIGGLMMYIIVRALGEMSVSEPSSGSFSYYAYKYIGNYAGFISGWNYWFNYIIVCMLELTATGIFIDYWMPNSYHWIFNLIIMSVFAGVNLMNVRFFGEFEFWFAGIKVFTVICLLIFGIYILGFQQETPQRISNISNLWNQGGFFAHSISGFFFSFVIVVFSFGGTELVGITAGDTDNPEKTIPMAINGIIFRILLFYIATLTVIMCLYPWNKISGEISPFVDVFKQMGIAKAASVMNLVAITAALSSLNSGIYGTARMMKNLSQQGNSFKLFAKTTANNVPIFAILLSVACIGVTVVLNYFFQAKIFTILLSIATLAAVTNWYLILITHMFFRKKSTKPSPYKSPWYPFTSILAMIFLTMVVVVMYIMPDFHMAIMIAPIWLAILSIAYLIKTKFENKNV